MQTCARFRFRFGGQVEVRKRTSWFQELSWTEVGIFLVDSLGVPKRVWKRHIHGDETDQWVQCLQLSHFHRLMWLEKKEVEKSQFWHRDGPRKSGRRRWGWGWVFNSPYLAGEQICNIFHRSELACSEPELNFHKLDLIFFWFPIGSLVFLVFLWFSLFSNDCQIFHCLIRGLFQLQKTWGLCIHLR